MEGLALKGESVSSLWQARLTLLFNSEREGVIGVFHDLAMEMWAEIGLGEQLS